MLVGWQAVHPSLLIEPKCATHAAPLHAPATSRNSASYWMMLKRRCITVRIRMAMVKIFRLLSILVVVGLQARRHRKHSEQQQALARSSRVLAQNICRPAEAGSPKPPFPAQNRLHKTAYGWAVLQAVPAGHICTGPGVSIHAVRCCKTN